MAFSPKNRPPGSFVPLRGLQLLCCAAVAAIGIHASARLGDRADTASVAMAAFESARAGESPIQAALQAATAGLSEIQVEVQRNDTMDRIFRRMKLSMSDLASIRALDAARKALDMLKPGELVTFVLRGEQLVGLVRPLDISKTLRVERSEGDAFVASVEEVPLQRNVVTVNGTIQSSLFAAGSAAGLHDVTTDAVADVFQWDIDFVLDLRVGDTFTVVYEQQLLDGRNVKDGELLAAEFVNDGKRFRAVRYQNAQGKVDFYTPEGVSLRKAFLKVPVQFSRISSVFNPSRRHPVLNTIRAHRGVDYAAPTGTKVFAAGAGRVQFRGVKGGFGNMVEILHDRKVVTRYGHLSKFAKGLTNGQKVGQGELIGYVGSTGLATGPHLHFEYIDERGEYVDPQKAMRRGEPGSPVPAAELPAFNQQTAPLLAKLDARQSAPGTRLAAR